MEISASILDLNLVYNRNKKLELTNSHCLPLEIMNIVNLLISMNEKI